MTDADKSVKNWETFDDVSLQSISVVNEEHPHPLETKSSPEPEPEQKPSSKPEPKSASKQISEQEKVDAILDPTKLDRKIPKASAISAPKNVNGKVLATVYPDNMICDWVTPPNYDAYSMPSILAIDLPTLPPPDYINSVEAVIKDIRFKLFSTIYSRMVAIWMTLWIFLLAITLLCQTKGGWPVMIWCLVWAVLLFVGIYVCAVIRKRIRIGLNKCIENANKYLVDHHFLLGIEDKGQISCHKVVLHFIRFNAGECTTEVMRLLKIKQTGGCVFGTPSTNQPNQNQMSNDEIEREANRLILRYSQEYVKSVVKKRLVFPSKPMYGVSDYAPKHCKSQMCLCQFIEDRRFNAKPKKWYEKYI
ncbi:unnamed protein product [Caenorhabditis angaria]|uniref:Uncharacterized protein n=1 Tax=Caenorhabditis angaria TaxID=860376 RepID=A0A9P1J0C4_9PELO|nr:unnamed protein product [Caenorhabditis angaria]